MKQEELVNNYTYHAPDEQKQLDHQTIRTAVFSAATVVNNTCPESREKSLVMTKLEEAMFWANAAIARN